MGPYVFSTSKALAERKEATHTDLLSFLHLFFLFKNPRRTNRVGPHWFARFSPCICSFQKPPQNEKSRPTLICTVFSFYFFTSQTTAERKESAHTDLQGFPIIC